MFLPCRPCCEGVPGCNDPAAAPNKPITDPAAEGEWVPSGTWDNTPPSGNTYNGITWTFVPNSSGTGGSTWFFYGSAETSNATGTASLAEQTDWDNICNWYSSSNAAPFYYHAASPNLKTRLDKRASTLPTAGATIHFYTTPNLATSGPKTCSVAYFHLGEVETGGTLTTTGTAIDSPGGAVFLTGGENYTVHPGGVQGTHIGPARYHGRARMQGQQTGNATFSGGSGLWGGTVTGDATFTQNSVGAPPSPIVYSTVTGNVGYTSGGNHYYLDIGGTCNVSPATSAGVLYSTSAGAVSVSSGTFSGYCASTVTITGTGNFYGGCAGHLTATGSGIVEAGLLGFAYSIPTATLSGSVTGRTGVSTSGSWGTVDCYDNVAFSGIVTTKASMYDSSRVGGNLTGDVDLYDTAIVGGNSFSTTVVVTGTAVFNNSSSCGRTSDGRGGKVVGTAIFNDSSTLQLTYGSVQGNATFNDTAVAHGIVTSGVATFNDAACSTKIWIDTTSYLACPATSNHPAYWTPTGNTTNLVCNGTAPAWYCNTTDTCGCG